MAPWALSTRPRKAESWPTLPHSIAVLRLSVIHLTRVDGHILGLRRRVEGGGLDNSNRQSVVHHDGSAQEPATEGFPVAALSASATQLGTHCRNVKRPICSAAKGRDGGAALHCRGCGFEGARGCRPTALPWPQGKWNPRSNRGAVEGSRQRFEMHRL